MDGHSETLGHLGDPLAVNHLVGFLRDADPVVPLQQSQLLLKKLQEAGDSAELFVKEGGSHPWLTIPEEIIKLATQKKHLSISQTVSDVRY